MGREIGVPIKPTITPDLIPEIFQFPEMSYPADIGSTLGSQRISKQDPNYEGQVAGKEEAAISADPTIEDMTANHPDTAFDQLSKRDVMKAVRSSDSEKEEKKGFRESTKNVLNSHQVTGQHQPSRNDARNDLGASDVEKKDFVGDSSSKGKRSTVKQEQLSRDFFKIPEPGTNDEIESPHASGLIPDPVKNPFVHKVDETTLSKDDPMHKAPDLRETKGGIIHPTRTYSNTNRPMPESPTLENVSMPNVYRISEPSKQRITTLESNMKSMDIRDQVGIVRSPEPEVTVNIGRIEVRTMPQQSHVAKPSQFPPLSLKDYLKQREEKKS